MRFHWIRRNGPLEAVITRIGCAFAKTPKTLTNDATTGARVRKVDALAAGGRVEEAAALLRDLAREFARDGHPRKAIALLHRCARLEPEAPDVERRIGELQVLADLDAAADDRRRSTGCIASRAGAPRYETPERYQEAASPPPTADGALGFELGESAADRYPSRGASAPARVVRDAR